ncbi:MAG: 23S rRNA (adenine(2503)-C(2))-methyltransferase RlmN [Planctomycetes bacterium]|nr:23S rRNA (adenine(2503)-C(2))-methyltransferase RlmN [Planctomycetota bacterium]
MALWREAESSSPGLIARLEALAQAEQVPATVSEALSDDPAYGTTAKLLLRLRDGREVEAVGIPMTGDAHRTCCVSSQVGCKQGCAFCRTARMGLVRDLAAHEIVGQVLAVNRADGREVRNVVFMGMGEPLDNAEAVAQAARVLNDVHGLSLAWDHITVSTVGRLASLARWEDLGLAKANLAVSLHSADPGVRAALVPAARIEDLGELRAALGRIRLPRDRRIMLAVVVIPGVTDHPGQIDALVHWIGDLPALVNLIPFNPFPGVDWRAPTDAEMRAMCDAVYARGIAVRTRTTKGRDALAACGQLATARGKPLPPAKPPDNIPPP